ncbi:MAG: 30S ribosomal protein S6 [bacterium]
MKKYELLLTLPGTLTDQEVEDQISEIKNLIEQNACLPEINSLGKIRLAYPIKQIRYGYYYTIIFESEPENVAKISEKLRLNKLVLRSIFNKYNAKSPKDVRLSMTERPDEKIKPTDRHDSMKEKITLQEIMSDKQTSEQDAIKTQPVIGTPVDVDLKEIDKRLDEILDGNDIVPGI